MWFYIVLFLGLWITLGMGSVQVTRILHVDKLVGKSPSLIDAQNTFLAIGILLIVVAFKSL